MLTVIMHKSHAFRFEVYYWLQIIVSQTLQIGSIIIVSILLNMINEMLIIFFIYSILKFKFKFIEWHATSFEACYILGVPYLTITIALFKYINIFVSILFLLTYGTLIRVYHNEFTIASKKIDLFIKNIKKRIDKLKLI